MRRLRSPVPLFLLVLLVPAYLSARVLFDWRAEALIGEIQEIDPDRAGSLGVRIESDAILMEHARARPWFGWGGWNRFRAGAALTDSLWSIILAANGYVGVAGLFGVLLMAQFMPLRRIRRARSALADHPEITTLVVVLALYALDCMIECIDDSDLLHRRRGPRRLGVRVRPAHRAACASVKRRTTEGAGGSSAPSSAAGRGRCAVPPASPPLRPTPLDLLAAS